MKPSQPVLAVMSLLLAGSTTWASPLARQSITTPLKPRANDYNCKSASHPNPVVLFHGLIANQWDDLIAIQEYLERYSFCTYTLTYGEYAEFPIVGGLKSIEDSAQVLGNFIFQVQSLTGASKVDIVGHSEGGFMSLYVPKFIDGISEIVDNIVAIAPPTHGTDWGKIIDVLNYLGNDTTEQGLEALKTLGCPSCEDMTIGGPAVVALDNGPIRQGHNNILVIATLTDEIVTPPSTAFIYEDGVTNRYLQDRCPLDLSAHIGMVFDANTWAEVHNWLDPTFPLPPICSISSLPVKE
ncbi:hypothetical protein DV736_g3727, partial [Chaetothyriales sp. CBS 134916]